MSGNNSTFACPACHAVNTMRGKALTQAMTCQSCGVYFRTGHWNNDTLTFSHKEEPAIPVYTMGRIDNILYQIIGFVVKKAGNYSYAWREYVLFNPYEGYAFLSEYDGHWNFLRPVESSPIGNRHYNFYNDDQNFQLYQKYYSEVIYARGEFFFDVVDVTAKSRNEEYIAPPYLYTLEENTDSLLWCKGKYITKDDLAQAFALPVENLPSQHGLGYTQPPISAANILTTINFTVVLFFLLAGLQLLFMSTSADKVVYEGDFKESDLSDQKLFVTPSFQLDGASKNLKIDISAPVDNDWFYTDFTLISETSGIEYNFSKDIEFYHGNDGGEYWTEGDTRGEAFLSSIPGGRYHINIYPQFSVSAHEFTLSIRRDVTTYSNFFMTLLGIAIFPLIYFLRRHMRERKRWRDSEYSPYHIIED